MKKYRYIGIIAIALFSFYYTEKIASYTLENNKIYQEIQNQSSNYNISYVNAEVDGDYITPGLNGKTVSIKNSFYNMQELKTFNSYYLLYDTSYPEVSIENNKDLIITKGNRLKNSVAFVLEYDQNIINYFKEKNIKSSILVDLDTFDKKETLEQINNEVVKFDNLESLINKYSKNSNICYLNEVNESICRKNNKYLVKSNKEISNSTYLDVKNNIESGDIYLVKKNTNIKSINIIINSILYKDLDIVYLSKLLSEERD